MKIKNYSFLTFLALLSFISTSSGQITNNTFTGVSAGTNNTGSYNNGFGNNALINNSGNSNSAFGINTLVASRGGFNSAFGNDALSKNFSGELNCAFGTRTLENNITGNSNIAIGHRSMGDSSDPGSYNTAIGYATLLKNQGNGNIAIGYFTPRHLLTGSSNVFIGNENGTNLVNGSGNVFLGKVFVNSSPSTQIITGNDTEKTVILADGDGVQKMLISQKGNVGLGLGNNVIPANRLDVSGGVVIGKNFTPRGIPFPIAGSLAPKNGLLVEGRVGIGTRSPNNKVEIKHGVFGNSGLRFTNLNSTFIPNTRNTSNAFLSVNIDGDVVLQELPNSITSNLLSSNGNIMTSNVNTLIATAPIVNSINNTINSNNQLVTTVNGVASAPVNLPVPTFTELDASTTNELQTLTQSGNTVTLSNGGGSFTLPTFTDTDAQSLSLVGNNLSISNGNTVVLPTYTDAQSLTIAGNTLSISNGNTITLPTFTDTDTDAQSLSLVGNNLSISNGNTVVLPTYTDAQSLTINGNTLSISNGNTITLPTFTDTDTDAQSLSLVGNALTISNGNTINLPTTTVIPGSNVTITGNGMPATPYQVSSIDTSLYGNNGVINQSTTTNNNRVVNMNDRNIWFNTATSPNHGKMYIGSSWIYPNNTGNYKLFVEGGILTEKVKVALRSTNNWADYVFAEDYKLMPLKQVEEFINKNNHLPGVDSAEDLAKNGLDLSEMQAKQMEKIEELTLYIIEQNKTLENQSKAIENQNKEIEELKNQMKELIQKK